MVIKHIHSLKRGIPHQKWIREGCKTGKILMMVIKPAESKEEYEERKMFS